MSDWYMEAGGKYIIKGQKIFGRNITISPDDIDKIRKRFNNTDCYVSVYMYNNGAGEDKYLYGPLYIDIDINIKGDYEYNKVKRDLSHIVTALNTIYKIPYEYIKIYYSGHKGFHIIVSPEIMGVKPHKQLNEYFKYIAQDLKKYTLFKTIDTKIYDNRRLFRLPNSIHGATGLYKTPVSYDFVRESTYEEMLSYASLPHEIDYPEPKLVNEAAKAFKKAIKEYEESLKPSSRLDTSNFKGTKLLPCIESILKNGATKGNRNNTTIVLASSMFQTGYRLEDVKDRLLKWNRELNIPKLSDREITTTVDSAHKGIQGGKRFGCRAIKDLDLCTPKDCNIGK